jgi:galactokinase
VGAPLSPVALQVLRRLSLWAVLLACLLALGPPVLREFGLLGPGPAEEVAQAEVALSAARTYGASEGQKPFDEAQRQLARARELAQEGEARQARHAAREARRLAQEAQRLALTAREEDRREAGRLVNDTDASLNRLEDLFTEVTPGLDKAAVARLLSLMKSARQAGAALSLTYEQAGFRKVIEEEPEARRVIESVRRELDAARKTRPPT